MTFDEAVAIQDVSVLFSGVTAVENFSLTVAPGERVAMLGRTGAGKSTILSLLVGSQTPSSGEVRVMGIDPHAEHKKLQGKVSMAFQAPNLMPWRTALGNVAIGPRILGRGDRHSQREIAQEWLSKVHLGSAGHKYPHQLSGGMRQRVSLARAFAIEPSVVFLDESFSALDEVTASELRTDFITLCDTSKTSAIVVTHSIEEAFTIAHRVIVLGRPARVLAEYDSRASLENRGITELQKEIQSVMATEETLVTG